MSELSKKLEQYSKLQIYPFHMPGHKRNAPAGFENPYLIDITEIDGFDDLHKAEGILKDEQEKAALVYGSKKCFYLVNGSTCGNLAAICASVNTGDKILIAHNCHRSVFHAAEIMQLKPVYVYPSNTRCGILGQIHADDISVLLKNNPDIKAAVITSPTYDGVVSDIKKIAEIVHAYDIPLIVDEAHGAHLGFHDRLPQNAVKLNADAVIMSLHKTLPSYTQTSLLHLCSDMIDVSRVEKYLDFFETSSPSYILMDSISRCIDLLAGSSIKKYFDDYIYNIEGFLKKTDALKHLKIIGADCFNKDEAYAFDIGKIIISTQGFMSGEKLSAVLLQKYSIQLELAKENYALAMTGIMDIKEGFDRLADALYEIDNTRQGIP